MTTPRLALPSPSLSRRLALILTLSFVVVAGVLMLAFRTIGQRALEREHEAASLRVAALFEASLRQAMLQRDLPGLSHLLVTLGHLPGLQAAALLEPGGQVRFASAPGRLMADERATLAGMCLRADCGPVAPPALQWIERDGQRALRVAYPVRNEARCLACHGEAAAKPVNGVMVLDFQPMAGERLAREQGGAWLLPISLGALGLLVAGIGWILRRQVLRPLSALASVVDRLGSGDLSAHSPPMPHADEIGRLAAGLDHMAGQVRSLLEARSAQGRFLQALVDASPDAIVVIDPHHRIVMANAAYERLLGHAPGSVVGQTCHRMSRGRAEPCPSTMLCCPLAECTAHDGPVQPAGGPPAGDAPARASGALSTVMAFARASGEEVDVEIHAAPLTGEDGRRLVVEVIRRLDDEVRFSQEQRLSAIGLLANGVAHEIHNPLASIRLALQASLRGLHDDSMARDELIEYLELVDQQIDRCVLITQRLLRLSQPSASLSQPVGVREAIDDVLALLAVEIGSARVQCVVDLPAQGLRVMMDEGELRQVLVNLVHNAVHAMPQGGLLTVRGQRQGDMAQVSVEDTGVGIAPDDMPLIFLPFYSRRADGRRGTGLGLAITKGLIEQRGGQIRASSRPGMGSRFEFELPSADVSPDAQHSAAPAPAPTIQNGDAG